ncbi:hypothetical protein [Sphingosinicella sp. BN140058]|uniref:hypothetical protein n=1 Tax=Sphingosinicella sp. BN140058 TaxID=1892855 RepID=UPI001013B969|nr:hypothetical protein [Sphingosinicella sp. BN140058]QAY78927.1 hypothetical protein ETR14_22090 [Sphingosinicella sp. BN140058]
MTLEPSLVLPSIVACKPHLYLLSRFAERVFLRVLRAPHRRGHIVNGIDPNEHFYARRPIIRELGTRRCESRVSLLDPGNVDIAVINER